MPSRFLRTIGMLVLFIHTSVLLAPSVQAAEQVVRDTQRALARNDAEDTPAETDAHSKALLGIEQRVLLLETRSRGKDARIQDLSAARAELQGLRASLKAQDEQVLRGFDAVGVHIRDGHLPDVILRRHEAAVARFKAAAAATQADLDAIGTAPDIAAVTRAAQRLRERIGGLQGQQRRQAVDPKNLPSRAQPKKSVAPRIRREQFAQWLPDDSHRPLRLASIGAIPLAVAGALSATDPIYRAPTEDVQITQAIRDLAQQLHNNPVEIYNWVHDNIEYVPTYGSIQGSELTLQAKRGNAVDTSSLLIALLRAAGISSRYVYGTVEIPIEKVKNWVGGVQASQAALDLLAQGGVPITGLAQGGRIVAARMEHVWVEAYIDFVPSRGTKNIAPDNWVPMDASFKQYTYAAGINFPTEVPTGFDPLTTLLSGATVDTSLGSIANVKQIELNGAFQDYQSAVTQYVTGLGSTATPEQVLGAKTIQPAAAPTLAASLPYRVTIAASRVASLTSPVKHYIRLQLFNSQLDEATDSPVLTQTVPLASLANKRLGVTYRAATPSDQAVLDSYAQAGAKELPAYLINVVPALQIDGVDIAVGPAVGMGEDQRWKVTLIGPGESANDGHTYTRVAGDEIVFGIDRNGVTRDMIASRLNTPAPNTSAESLHQTALLYWAETDLTNTLAGRARGFVPQRLPSAGVFASPMTVEYSYGVPRVGFYQSHQIDIGRSFLGAVGSDGGSAVDFQIGAGVRGSLLEGRVLDQVTQAGQGSAASAIQLLSDAAVQGIPIYTITGANAAAVLPRLSVDSAMLADISAALSVGRTVIVSERAPEGQDWSGTGYVILDPETGSGAYLIKGALNGGEIPDCERQRVPLTVAIQQTLETLFWLAVLAALIAGAIALTGSSGGAGAPAGAMMLVVAVSVAAIIWPTPADAAAPCNDKCHRGRVQAQGGDANKSVSWALATPPTLAMGLGFLTQLKAQLTAKQLAERADSFLLAEDWMRRAAAGGGVCARDVASSISFPRNRPERVDIELRAGKAFVP